MLPADTRILKDAEAVAVEACRLISEAAQESIRQRHVFRLVLAGGRTPRHAYELLAQTEQDWIAWEIFWGDERCLPADHPERNSRMANDAWLTRVAIPQAQIYPIPAELGATKAALVYAETICDKGPFDLVILGMGEDGHTASLFPGYSIEDGLTLAVHDAPKPPAERVSLNIQTVRACRNQLVLVSGSGKKSALLAWRNGEGGPIAQVVLGEAMLLVDRACFN